MTTYYVNPAWHTGISFEREKKGTDTIEKLYVAAGGLPMAMSERLNKGAVRHYFFQKDHLGSVVAIFNENNQIEESTNYKAFGHKRLINQIKQDDSPLISKRTTRGFTGHEHLDRVGLIHMNARLYDKDLGRFISPDTVIPSIANPQSINRYAYVYNNPLSLTDPSGNVPFGASLYGMVDRMMASMITQSANAVVAAGAKTKYDGVSHNAAVKSAIDQSPSVPASGLSSTRPISDSYSSKDSGITQKPQLQERFVIRGGSEDVRAKYQQIVYDYLATREGADVATSYFGNVVGSEVDVNLVSGSFVNTGSMGTINIGLASQSGFGVRVSTGKDGTYVKLTGLRTFAHEAYHALAKSNSSSERAAIESENKVIWQNAVSNKSTPRAGVRVEYDSYPLLAIPPSAEILD